MFNKFFSTSLFIGLLFGLTGTAQAWTAKDTAWQTAYLTAHIADWGQTRDIAAQCATTGAYYETNPMLGKCPSAQLVNTYFLTTALIHTAVAHMLPQKYRRMFQVGTLGMELNYIGNNKRIGLKVAF